jgi:prepilin-type N-terminal cleavage/methylation domain-containing protein
MITNKKKGFTLIEILIVVAIIAILASVVLVGLGPTQQAGRDARRISDLSEVQNGLELYYNKCGYYPGASNATDATCDASAPGGTAVTAYTNMAGELQAIGIGISSVPVDPNNTAPHQYTYATNGASGGSYVLGAVLENTSNSVFTTYNPPSDVAADHSPAALTCGSKNTGPDYCISL